MPTQKKILLADDDSEFASMYRKVLEKAGFSVVEAPIAKTYAFCRQIHSSKDHSFLYLARRETFWRHRRIDDLCSDDPVIKQRECTSP